MKVPQFPDSQAKSPAPACFKLLKLLSFEPWCTSGRDSNPSRVRPWAPPCLQGSEASKDFWRNSAETRDNTHAQFASIACHTLNKDAWWCLVMHRHALYAFLLSCVPCSYQWRGPKTINQTLNLRGLAEIICDKSCRKHLQTKGSQYFTTNCYLWPLLSS